MVRALTLATLVALAGCAAPSPQMSATQRAARTADMTPLGAHPAGITSSFPPADPSFRNLTCTGGPENTTVCARESP